MLSVLNIFLEIGNSKILQDLSFKINSAETVGIIGPNGSGKTTLFNTLSGFHFPQKGQILFQGQEITNINPDKRAKLGIGRVFQNFGIFREMTLLENIITAIEGKDSLLKTIFSITPSYNKQITAQAMLHLEEIGLASKAKQKASSLSGGQMRLLEIVRILAFGAELFLLDEPTAGVSPKMKADVANLILKLQENKKTVIIIEHDINFIKKFCQRIIVLDQGTVILDDTPENVSQSDKLQEIYFGKENS